MVIVEGGEAAALGRDGGAAAVVATAGRSAGALPHSARTSSTPRYSSCSTVLVGQMVTIVPVAKTEGYLQ